MWVKLSTAGFFPRCFFGKRTADPERSRLIYYTSIDAVSAKDVPLGDLIVTSHPIGSYPTKNPHFGDVNGDFQLKRLRAYLRTEETFDNA
jgi:hypothetical protein